MTNKKVWFITGAGRGMGVHIAKAALAAGSADYEPQSIGCTVVARIDAGGGGIDPTDDGRNRIGVRVADLDAVDGKPTATGSYRGLQASVGQCLAGVDGTESKRADEVIRADRAREIQDAEQIAGVRSRAQLNRLARN